MNDWNIDIVREICGTVCWSVFFIASAIRSKPWVSFDLSGKATTHPNTAEVQE